MTGSSAVIDASLALRLVLPNPQRERARSVLSRLAAEGIEVIAPALWSCEVTSVLCKLVHFGQLTAEEARLALERLMALDVRLVVPDATQNRRALEWTLRLDRAAAYDSYYLALASSLGCDLWTADRRMCSQLDLPWVRLADDV